MEPAEETTQAASGGMTPLVREIVRPYHGWIAVILVAMLLETAASIAAPWPLKVVIDSVVGHHPLPGWAARLLGDGIAGDKASLALAAGIAVVLIALVGAIATYVDNYYTESVGQWVANDLRLKVYRHLDRLSLAWYDQHRTGSLLSTITTDIGTIQDFASSATLGIAVDVLTILGMVGVMFWLDWDFAMIAVGVTPFLLLFVTRFKAAVKKATHEVRKRQSVIVSRLQQSLESMRVVNAFGRQELEEQMLEQVSREAVDAALRARRVKSMLSPTVNVVVALCTGFVLWRGAGLVLSNAMTVGELTVFLAYLGKFFKPVQDLAKMTNAIAQAAVGVERVSAILDADARIPEKPDARPAPPGGGRIAFEHVAFAYAADSPVLRDVVAVIESGQRVGVVGPTGGGKSTFVSMIPRFYDPTGGRITLDGIDTRDLQLDSLRASVGFVLQDTVLFQGSVRDNIAYGREGATDEEVREAARLANAEEFIERMPHGYDTEVGERGSTLSGGQRQRIGIARALVRNSPILILDEPTAALDTESERLVMEALARLMEGRTTITIAHRLSTIRDCDRIFVLKDGVVAEQGTHAELLAADGVYAELHRIQFGDESAPATDAATAAAGA